LSFAPRAPWGVDFERRVQEGLPFVEVILRWLGRRFGGRVPFEEMRAYAHEALLDAARTYDPARASLPTYISRKVRWALLDKFRDERKSRRVAAYATALLAAERVSADYTLRISDVGLTEEEQLDELSSYLEAQAAALAMGLVVGRAGSLGEDDTPEEHTARAQMAERLRLAVRVLPDRERALIERHYFGGEDFDEIAADLGISKSWASRLHTQALGVLGTALGEDEPWEKAEKERAEAEKGEGEEAATEERKGRAKKRKGSR